MIKTNLESLNIRFSKNQNTELTKNDMQNYGIVYTPFFFAEKILNLIPEKYFKDPELCWLDIGAGLGVFSIILYKKLDIGLCDIIMDNEERHNHIVEKMIYMIEIHPEHISRLKEIFGKKANIINRCFLSFNKYEYPFFDFIIGNPPYNMGGLIKTPTNSKSKKTDDGRAIYVEFIKKSLEILLDGGFLNVIIPSLWLKPDKAGLYDLLTNLKIHKLYCLSTSATYKSFDYKAQTPTCFFLIEKVEDYNNGEKLIKIFDKCLDSYVDYKLLKNWPIPCQGISIINKLIKYVEKYGNLVYYKSNTSSRNIAFSETKNGEYKYQNIKTCILDGLQPKLEYNWSNKSCSYFNISKLILGHKMYGFPYFDIIGDFGISKRDSYIFSGNDYSFEELIEIQAFLSTKFALFIFGSCNYRMRYLERYAFQFLPAITKIGDFPKLTNVENRSARDKKLCEFFEFSVEERDIIENYSRDYHFFIF